MIRVAVTACILLALCGVIGWICPANVALPLLPGTIYDVAVDGDTSQFDLPFAEEGEQYLLIVANTSRDPQSRRVSLWAESREAVEACRIKERPPLANTELTPAIPRERLFSITAGERPPPTDERTFWLQVGPGSSDNPATYRPITARLAAHGPRVAVYVDREDSIRDDAPQAIVRSYELAVLPAVAAHLGEPADVDGDGRLSIVLTSWLSRLDGGETSLGGMVWSDDYRPDMAQPYSNRADVLYLNAGVRPGPHLETLLAHELAHAITASGRLSANTLWSAREEEESWLNEAISHVAENLHSDNWSNLDYRIAAFLAAPGSTPLAVASYQQHGLWRCPAARGSTYLFLRWCVDRYGPGLLSRLIYSPRSGIKNLEAATGTPFDELLRRWAVDLFLQPNEAGHSGPAVASAAMIPAAKMYCSTSPQTSSGSYFELWDLAAISELPEQNVAGTSFCYVLLTASKVGARRIHVKAEQGAALQLTLVRLQEDHVPNNKRNGMARSERSDGRVLYFGYATPIASLWACHPSFMLALAGSRGK